MTKSSRTVHQALEAQAERNQAIAEAELDWFDTFMPDWEELQLPLEERRLVPANLVERS